MQKDYIITYDKEPRTQTEDVFVEEYWTKKWEEQKGVVLSGENAERQDEYPTLMKYLRKMPKGSKVLDGGCGLGEWVVHLDSKGFETYGLDLSRSTVEKLKKIFPTSRFEVGDIRSSRFEDAFFDAYFSWGTFEHFEKGAGDCFSEARRILKKGGYLIVSVPFQNGRHLRKMRLPFNRWDKRKAYKRNHDLQATFYQWRFSRGELEREFYIHGFKVVESIPIHKEQGITRMLQMDYSFKADSRSEVLARRFLNHIIPSNFVSHMLLMVGKKI